MPILNNAGKKQRLTNPMLNTFSIICTCKHLFNYSNIKCLDYCDGFFKEKINNINIFEYFGIFN